MNNALIHGLVAVREVGRRLEFEDLHTEDVLAAMKHAQAREALLAHSELVTAAYRDIVERSAQRELLIVILSLDTKIGAKLAAQLRVQDDFACGIFPREALQAGWADFAKKLRAVQGVPVLVVIDGTEVFDFREPVEWIDVTKEHEGSTALLRCGVFELEVHADVPGTDAYMLIIHRDETDPLSDQGFDNAEDGELEKLKPLAVRQAIEWFEHGWRANYAALDFDEAKEALEVLRLAKWL